MQRKIVDIYFNVDYLKVTSLTLRANGKSLPEVNVHLVRCLHRRGGLKLSEGESFLDHSDNIIPIAHYSLPDITTGQ